MEYTNEIFGVAEGLLGMRADREEALLAMCAAAGDELRRRLKEGLEPEEIKEVFISAAGVLALSMYIQLGDAEDTASLRVGGVSLSRRGAGATRSSAATLRRQAETMLLAYLEDSSFDFRGVKG